MEHSVSVSIDGKTLDRVNRLLAINSLSQMTDDELISAGANTDQCEGILYVEFDDGATLSYDLCSGNENYFDDVVWTSADKKCEITLECSFELDDIEFIAPNGDCYVVKLQRMDERSR